MTSKGIQRRHKRGWGIYLRHTFTVAGAIVPPRAARRVIWCHDHYQIRENGR